MVAVIEALRILGDRDEEIEVFSLGTCGNPEGKILDRDQVDRNIQDWRFGGDIAKVSIASQEIAFDMMTGLLVPHLKKKISLIRFPSERIPNALHQYLDLDETRSIGLDALISQARQDANMTNSEIQKGTCKGQKIKAIFTDMPQREVKNGGK